MNPYDKVSAQLAVSGGNSIQQTSMKPYGQSNYQAMTNSLQSTGSYDGQSQKIDDPFRTSPVNGMTTFDLPPNMASPTKTPRSNVIEAWQPPKLTVPRSDVTRDNSFGKLTDRDYADARERNRATERAAIDSRDAREAMRTDRLNQTFADWSQQALDRASDAYKYQKESAFNRERFEYDKHKDKTDYNLSQQRLANDRLRLNTERDIAYKKIANEQLDIFMQGKRAKHESLAGVLQSANPRYW